MDELEDEVYLIEGRYVLVKRTVHKILHPTEAGGIIQQGRALDRTGHLTDNKGKISVL